MTSLDLLFVERVTLIEVQIHRQSEAESPVEEWLDLGESDSFSMATTGLTPGKYTVEFEAVSFDGHTVDGEYRFELALDAEPPSGLPEAETEPTSALVPIAAAGIGLALMLAFFMWRRASAVLRG